MRSSSRFRAPHFFVVFFTLVLVLLIFGLVARETHSLTRWSGEAVSPESVRTSAPPNSAGQLLNDSLGDGFPDILRLENGQDRENFIQWFTYLAEASYDAPSKQSREEVGDCAGLIRYAYRNALVPHTAEWRRSTGIPFEPGFGDVVNLPDGRWPLARALFRTRPGPLLTGDLRDGTFSEFADAVTLLNYNSFFVSNDIRAAQRGDLIFFHQVSQREPFHTMLFLGNSHFRPAGTDWVVYHTGDLGGLRGEIREVEVSQLLNHPEPRWRPLATNPNFMGVYRLEILR